MSNCAKTVINEILKQDKKVIIKSLGDSIIHGVSGSSFNKNGRTIVDGFARNIDGYC